MPYDLLAVAERCEAATGPSEQLDLDIEFYLQKLGLKQDWFRVKFTHSIDAALTLVPEGMGWAVGTHDEVGRPYASVGCHIGVAQTPELAFAAAALRAWAAR